MTTEKDVYSSLILKQNAGILTIFDQKERLFKNYRLLAFESFQGNL